MECPIVPREVGQKVWVNLGYGTVKAGAVYGAKVTVVPDRPAETKIEYIVYWFGAQDRNGNETETFEARYVFDSPSEAFGQ